MPLSSRAGASALLALLALAGAGCRSGRGGGAGGAVQTAPLPPRDSATIARVRADSARYPYTEADIHFMSGMVGHHAQAIVMSRWAESHGASPSVRTLADRIINAQRDEILTLRTWLNDRGLPVPEATPGGMTMVMNGVAMVHTMPGMLTEAQMRQLDAARGPEFDRLFLTDMIQHHQGAIAMVKELFDSYGGAQDQVVFKVASDINVDQITEVARMQRMLVSITLGGGSP